MAPKASLPGDAAGRQAILTPTFVGRETELATLTSALGARPAVVLIEGEAGIGKSRLLRELLARPGGKRQHTLVANCPPFRQPHTLGPVVDAVRHGRPGITGLRLSALAGALRPLFPEWAADMPPAPEPAEDATAARHRLFRALDELLACLGVVVLVVEDAHWADEATLEFLLHLISQQAQRVSLLVTYRPEDVPPGSLLRLLPSRLPPGTVRERIVLGPLSEAETSGLVSSMLGGEYVSGEFASFLHQRTDGVPLAAEELVRLMGDRADLTRRNGEWVGRRLELIDVPPTIREAVLERVERMSDSAQALLRGAAVLAEGASEQTLSIVAGLPVDQVHLGLSEALACGLLREDAGLLLFRHALAGRAVYEAIPSPERRLMHRRAGETLAHCSPGQASRLARHFREAGETGKWYGYAEEAADLALASGDESSAAALLYELVTSAELAATDAARLTRKIPFASFTGPERYRELARALRSIADNLPRGSREEADVRFQLGQVLVFMEEWPTARAELECAIPQLTGDQGAAARAMMLLAWPRGTNWHVSVHLRWLRRASELAAALARPDRLRFTVDKASALLMLGQQAGWTEAARIPRNSATDQGRRETARSDLNIGDAAMRWGRYGEASQRLWAAVSVSRSHRYDRLHDQVLVTQIHLDWFTGRWAGLAERAGGVAGDDDVQPVTRLEAVLVSGLLDAAAGAFPQADERLQGVLAETRRKGELEYTMEPAGALARMRLAEGRVDDALAVTEEPIGIVAAKGIWVWATEISTARITALVAAGRNAEAEALVAAFASGLQGRDAPASGAALKVCKAIIAEARGEHSRAGTLFARAADVWQTLPRPYESMLARECEARCLLAAGETATALPVLSEAFQGLCQLGARGDADRLMQTLREHGLAVRRPSRGGRPSYGNRLSPRELDVVRLLIDGRTNRQIAEALVLSPKTVASHLHSAMGKLGVSSRTALAVTATELGIVDRTSGADHTAGANGAGGNAPA